MEIKYIVEENQINIYFNYNLVVSNSLKKSLKNVRFDGKGKFWFTSVDQEPFLVNWIPKAQRLALEDELDQAKRRNAEILSGIKEAEREVEKKEDLIDEIKQMGEVLKANQSILDEVKGKLAQTTAKHNAVISEIGELISKMIDVQKLRAIADEMAKNMNYKIKGSRERFDLAQAKALEMRAIVREAGFRFDALERIASALYNRPDRDNPNLIPDQAWYKLVKIEE